MNINDKLPSFDPWGADRYPKPTAADREEFQKARGEAQKLGRLREGRINLKFDRTLTGNELAQALKDTLTEQGIDPDDVMIRYFSKDRLQKAKQNGNDRDTQSNVGYFGSFDGEEEWMRGVGVYCNDQVTYAAPIGHNLMGG